MAKLGMVSDLSSDIDAEVGHTFDAPHHLALPREHHQVWTVELALPDSCDSSGPSVALGQTIGLLEAPVPQSRHPGRASRVEARGNSCGQLARDLVDDVLPRDTKAGYIEIP